MPSLPRANDRFGTLLTIVQGGSGDFKGILSDPPETASQSTFIVPSRMLRVDPLMPVSAGMVVRTPAGLTFMVGTHGDAEGNAGHLFRSFRLIAAERQFSWQTRTKVRDVVTGLDRDAGLVEAGPIWGAYTPQPEQYDRQLHMSVEEGQFVTTANVKHDDVVNGKRVSRIDQQLGLYILTLG